MDSPKVKCTLDDEVKKKYNVVKLLGKGGFGSVFLAENRETALVVAIKKLGNAFRCVSSAQMAYREVLVLKQLTGHPNIIKLLDILKAVNHKDLYLVLEYMDTDLHRLMHSNDLKRNEKIVIMSQLLQAVSYIHSANVVHRDLKPENVLVSADLRCKVADFGLARSLNQITSDKTVINGLSLCGTLWFQAPEILLESSSYSTSVDLWSVGCILGELLSKAPVFAGSDIEHQINLILQALPPSQEDLTMLAGYGRKMKPPETRTGTLMLQAPAEDKDIIDLIKQMLVLNPVRRLTAAEALQHFALKDIHLAALEPKMSGPLQDESPTFFSRDDYRWILYKMAS